MPTKPTVDEALEVMGCGHRRANIVQEIEGEGDAAITPHYCEACEWVAQAEKRGEEKLAEAHRYMCEVIADQFERIGEEKGLERAAVVAEEYDGDGLETTIDTQFGNAGKTMHDIAKAIRALK